MEGSRYIGWAGSWVVALGVAGVGVTPPAIGWAAPASSGSDTTTSKSRDTAGQSRSGEESSARVTSSSDPEGASSDGARAADSDPDDRTGSAEAVADDSAEAVDAEVTDDSTETVEAEIADAATEDAVAAAPEAVTDHAPDTVPNAAPRDEDDRAGQRHDRAGSRATDPDAQTTPAATPQIAAVTLPENLPPSTPSAPIAPAPTPAPLAVLTWTRREVEQSAIARSAHSNAQVGVAAAAPVTPGPVATAATGEPVPFFTAIQQWFQRTFAPAAPTFSPQEVSVSIKPGASSPLFSLAGRDADTDTLTYSIDDKATGTGSAAGALSITGESATYTPPADWDGGAYADTFTVTASDAHDGFHIHGFAGLLHMLTFGLLGATGHTATSTVTVNVRPVSTPPQPPEPEPEPPAPEPEPPAASNLLQNPTFSEGLSGWQLSGDVSSIAVGGDAAVQLAATETTDARISQRITNLKPQTLYTLALTMRTSGSAPSDVWGVWGVVDGPQLDKTGSGQSATLTERRLTVYTGAEDTEVTVFVAAGRNAPPGVVTVTDVRFVEGALDPPAIDPTAPGASPPPLVSLPEPGQNLVANGQFAPDAHGWVLDQAVRQPDATMRIVSTPERTGRIAQDLPMLLAPNTDYVLTARARVDAGDATITVASPDGSLHAWQLITDTAWQPVEIAFTTPDRWVSVKVAAENWRGDDSALYVDDITLLANGHEWLDTPNPYPSPQPALFDDFTDGIDSGRWLIADKAWGGDNGGVVPANVGVVDGVVRLAAHGDRYTGDVVGHGDRTTRVGATIVTRDYYASGRYEVRARVPQTLGAASAFWSYHYIEYHPAQPEYWTEPNRIRNSEIDWEFPTARDDGTPDDPVSFDYARANTWGGKFGGEGGNVSLRPDIGALVADGEFHTYAYEWHAGGDGRDPFVAWSIDDVEVARYTGDSFGQDNVPYRASRFWIGIWFPASGYRDQVGWAGDPDFDTAYLDIDWVRITPTYAPADVYEPETWPNGFYATPDEYPQ